MDEVIAGYFMNLSRVRTVYTTKRVKSKYVIVLSSYDKNILHSNKVFYINLFLLNHVINFLFCTITILKHYISISLI